MANTSTKVRGIGVCMCLHYSMMRDEGAGLRAVSRFKCHSDLYDMELMLDVNVSIYPLKVCWRSTRASSRLSARKQHRYCLGYCRLGISFAWHWHPPSTLTMPPLMAPTMRYVFCLLQRKMYSCSAACTVLDV